MESNDATTTSARAHELRASLGTRREVEALLAEASATREAAVADADAVIEEAQQLSEQLVRESRAEAERTAAEARERAEGVVGRARTEAEDINRQARSAADAVRARAEAQVEEHRRRVRAELTEQVTREVGEQSRREMAKVQERQQAMIGDLEASVRILGVSLESAVTTIGDMLGALDSLRVHTVESLGEAGAPMTTPPRHAESPADELFRNTSEGAARNGGAIPAATSAFDEADTLSIDEFADQIDPDDLDELDDDTDPPLTATEAYLRSAGLDHDDAPLSQTDDSEVSARYARDAMRATARGRSRRDEETLDVVPERSGGRTGPDERAAGEADPEGSEDDASGKPLGWLFRSS
jgi:cell division septum initiation protein DivIVA